MSSLPRVAAHTRERIAREFDDLGPDACLTEISLVLANNNPELLDMARKCARDLGSSARIMVGFCMFYRLLDAESRLARASWAQGDAATQLDLLPRVTAETRDDIVREIDRRGSETFTRRSIEELERTNPELLQMVHNFASRHPDYLGVMQGFALLYASLVAQSSVDRAYMQ